MINTKERIKNYSDEYLFDIHSQLIKRLNRVEDKIGPISIYRSIAMRELVELVDRREDADYLARLPASVRQEYILTRRTVTLNNLGQLLGEERFYRDYPKLMPKVRKSKNKKMNKGKVAQAALE